MDSFNLSIDFDFEKHEKPLSEFDYQDIIQDYLSSSRSLRGVGDSVKEEFDND